MDDLVRRVEKLEEAIGETRREFAEVRAMVRIYTDSVDRFEEAMDEMKSMLLQHITDERSYQAKVYAGIVTAVLTGVGTMGTMLWAVFEILKK